MKKYSDTILKAGTGFPIQGVVVAVTLTDTNTPATLYAEDDLTTGLPTNTVTTNELGYFEFYIADGSYDISLTTGGATTVLTDVEIFDFDLLNNTLGDTLDAAVDAAEQSALNAAASAQVATAAIVTVNATVATVDADRIAAQEAAGEAAATATQIGGLNQAISFSSSKPAHLFQFMDRYRRILAYIDNLNTLVVSSIKSLAGYKLGELGRIIADEKNPNTFFAVRDHSRRTYLSVGVGGMKVGKIRARAITADLVNGTSPNSYVRFFGTDSIHLDGTEREVIVSNGQSLSVGGGGNGGPLTVDQPYGNLMFNGGVRFWEAALTSLIPHIEANTGNGGETILGGFQAMLAQLFNHFGIPPLDNRLKTIAIAPGLGETAIASFRQGGGLFTRYMQAVDAAVTLSPGKVVKSRGHLWLQGESDAGNAGYIAQLVALAAEVDAGVRAETGQTEPVITFTYQMAGGDGGYWMSEAAKQSALIKVAVPIYWAEENGLVGANYDNVHRSAKGSMQLGAAFAVAWFSEFILRKPWRPLQLAKDARGMLRCRVDGADLIVKYDVPFGGELVFDNGTWARINRGFYLFASNGTTAKPISEVILESRDEVRLVGANAASGDILRVGFTAQPGNTIPLATNLRDNQGATITFDDLNGEPIHNWAIGEQHILTAGELS